MQNALLKNNDLLAQLKGQLRAATPRIEGRVKGTEKGFGFLEAEDGKSYFISPPNMKKVLHGDRIQAALHEEQDRKGEMKQTAEPETLIEPSLTRFIGRIQRVQGKLAVVPDHPQLNQPLKGKTVSGLDEASLTDGDWVVAHLERHPLKPKDNSFFVEVTELIAKDQDHYAPWWVILARHALPKDQPEINQAWQLEDPAELVREDLTHLPFVTIDSAQTKDMDDALCIRPRAEGGWTLWVAIADPSAYVAEGSPADIEAKARAFTLYLPARTITMLPKPLSDDLCSLMPKVRRPALVARLEVAADGQLADTPHFCAAWITSQAKLDYQLVSDWLDEPKAASWQPDSEEQAAQLQYLAQLAQQRLAWRHAHALVFKETPDYRFVLDEAGQVIDIQTEERRVAHRLVEEAMLLANLALADLLSRELGQGVFNTHVGFEADQAEQVLKLLEENGLKTEAGQAFDAEYLASLAGFCDLRRQLDALPSGWLDARLRKYQGFSLLSLTPAPHFGLGVSAYATWTSPIRKYGDLLNHRLLKAWLIQTQPHPLDDQLAEALSSARKINRMAERDVKDWLYARFLADQVGQSFAAQIFSINRGGMKVRLVDNGAAVFIPASTIHANRDELICDGEQGWVMIQDQIHYRLTDQVQIELTEVRVDQRALVGRLISSNE